MRSLSLFSLNLKAKYFFIFWFSINVCFVRAMLNKSRFGAEQNEASSCRGGRERTSLLSPSLFRSRVFLLPRKTKAKQLIYKTNAAFSSSIFFDFFSNATS